jgi:YHS domain-containing protein
MSTIKNLTLIAMIAMAMMTSCKDKNAKPADNQDIPGQIVQPGSINPQSVAGRLEQATSAVAAQTAVPWAGNTDPVCSMKIDRDAEDTLQYQGKMYGFCSESCKESFQENPQKWVTSK